MTHRRRPVALLSLLLAGSAVAATACGSATPDNRAPVVRLDAPGVVAAQPGAPVRLSGSGTDPEGGTVTLTWDLGDGTTSEGATDVEHSYAAPGTYRVVLGGRDADGAAATPAELVVQVGDTATAATATGGNQALRFGGTGADDVDRVKILVDDPSGGRVADADIGATDTTVEMWLRTRPGENSAGAVGCGDADAWINGNVVLDRDRYNQGRKFGLSIAAGLVVFGLTGEDGSAVSLCSRTAVDDDRWHHVAVTRAVADGAIRLFVDGRLEAELSSGPTGDVSYPDGAQPRSECDGGRPCTRSDPYLVIGAEKHDAGSAYPSYSGLVDELRLSEVVRYTGDFPVPTRRFEPDAATAALYHFDEGSGPLATDSSGRPNPSDGVLQVGGDLPGPVRTPSDAPTGP